MPAALADWVGVLEFMQVTRHGHIHSGHRPAGRVAGAHVHRENRSGAGDAEQLRLGRGRVAGGHLLDDVIHADASRPGEQRPQPAAQRAGARAGQGRRGSVP